jgi:hypothetical protein
MANVELAVPNDFLSGYDMANDRPAYVTDAPENAGRNLEDIDLNQYWEQPNETSEETKPDINDLNASVEDIAGPISSAIQDRREMENELEAINASNLAYEEAGAKGIDPPPDEDNKQETT